MNIRISKAKPSDHKKLTEISFSSKRYWNYPNSYFEIWKNELTIKTNYIEKNLVYKAEYNNQIIGYYAITNVEKSFFSGPIRIQKGHWLEHIFIIPEYIGKKIGSALMEHAKNQCLSLNCNILRIMADPHSKNFYQKIGAEFIKEIPSNIEGRKICYFEWYITNL